MIHNIRGKSPDWNPMELVWDEVDIRWKQSNLQVQHICGNFCNSEAMIQEEAKSESKSLD